jgi:hypothetical protein
MSYKAQRRVDKRYIVAKARYDSLEPLPLDFFMHLCEMLCSTSDAASAQSELAIAPPCKEPLPCKEFLPKYPYVFRRIYYCGHPDQFIQVTRLHDQDCVTHILIAHPGEVKSVPTYSLERCRSCADRLRSQDQEVEDSTDIKRQLRSLAVYQGEILCAEPGAARMKGGFERALQRLVKSDGVGHEAVHGPHNLNSVILVQAPDASLYRRAMKIVYDFIEKRTTKTAETKEENSEPQMRGG